MQWENPSRSNTLGFFAYNDGRRLYILPKDIMAAIEMGGITKVQAMADFLSILAGQCPAYHVRPEDILYCSLACLNGWTDFGSVNQRALEKYEVCRDVKVNDHQAFIDYIKAYRDPKKEQAA